jgi:hypothetical protein
MPKVVSIQMLVLDQMTATITPSVADDIQRQSAEDLLNQLINANQKGDPLQDIP